MQSMLEKLKHSYPWRFDRIRKINETYPEDSNLDVAIHEEIENQEALDYLGITLSDSPSNLININKIIYNSNDSIQSNGLTSIEVVGMPGSGKTSLINRLLRNINTSEIEPVIVKKLETPDDFKRDNWDLKTTNPYQYTVLKNQNILAGYEIALKAGQSGILISDRGLTERRVFLRTYFHQGKICPTRMVEENLLLGKIDIPPTQQNIIILLMVRPEYSMDRYGYWNNPGPVINMNLLPLLYEQYCRLHYEITFKKSIPFIRYCCIDAEDSPDIVYERFSKIFRSFLDII